jgi:hypothetical protein
MRSCCPRRKLRTVNQGGSIPGFRCSQLAVPYESVIMASLPPDVSLLRVGLAQAVV